MTREQFVVFLEEFKNEYDRSPDHWENNNLSDFLEAMIAYTKDIQGYYDNMKMNVNADEPSWENFRNILQGASIYE